jgi:hypothetical protein
LTSALVGDEWSASCPSRFNPGERALGTYWIGECLGPTAGLDNVEKRIFIPNLIRIPTPQSCSPEIKDEFEKCLEGGGLGIIEVYSKQVYSSKVPGIVDVPVEIRTEHFLNTSELRYN